MRSLVSIIRQSIWSFRFLVAILGTVLLLLLSCTEGLVQSFRTAELIAFEWHTELIISAMGGDGMSLALPFLAALPFTTAFIDDIKSGFIKVYLPRSGLNQYIFGKAIACAISGGLAILLGTLLAYVIVALVVLPIEVIPTVVVGTEKPPWSPPPIWGEFAMLFGSGCFWSLVGLLLASLTNSRYMAYAGPFVVCYVLIILYERYFDSLYVLYPREWLNPSELWVLGAWGVAILLIVLSGVLGCIFAFWARRKLVLE